MSCVQKSCRTTITLPPRAIRKHLSADDGCVFQSGDVLTRSIRNAVYDILLGDVWLRYHLAYWPAARLRARGALLRVLYAAGASCQGRPDVVD